MESWIVDAKDLDVSAMGTFHESLFHKTGLLNEFLYLTKHATLVVAPKGYGKTLILKEKKQSLSSDYDIFPRNVMLDKPTGVPNFRIKEYGDILNKDSYWKMLWLLSIGFIIIKSSHKSNRNELKIPRKVHDIIFENPKRTPCEILTNLLLINRSDFHALENYYHSEVAARIRDVHKQTAFFIDNIDEFFEQRLYDSKTEEEKTVYRDLWNASQVGLALAARDISSINPHIKIFASIRKEAVPRLVAAHGVGLQIKGAAIEIKYDNDDLYDILLKNIKNDNPIRKYLAEDREYLQSFFGPDHESFFHPKTGDEENAASYLLRHTLRRPRDIAHIGRAVRAVEFQQRKTKRIKDVVAQAASEILTAYFAEMKPHLQLFQPELLFPLIKSNALSRKQIKSISEKYDAMIGMVGRDSGHIFCNMYKLGLLGWVATDFEDGSERQYFSDIGEVPLESHNCLPDSHTYLIHPMLDETISRYNRKYLKSLNSINVIGFKRTWRHRRPYQFVIKGDLKGFSGIMKDPDKYSAFVTGFISKIKELCEGLDSRFEGGDSMLIISENPRHILDVGLKIDQYTRKEYILPMRFGCDVGFIEVVGGNGQLKGNVLRRAARLEAAVKVAGIFLTEEYILETEKMGMRIDNVMRCVQSDLPHLSFDGEKFNIAKSGGDDDTLVSVFKIRS